MKNVRAEQMESCITMEKRSISSHRVAINHQWLQKENFYSMLEDVKVTWTMQEQLVVGVNTRPFHYNTFF